MQEPECSYFRQITCCKAEMFKKANVKKKKKLYCLARVVCNIDEQLYEECTMLYMYLLLYQMFITLYKEKLRFCDALLCIVQGDMFWVILAYRESMLENVEDLEDLEDLVDLVVEGLVVDDLI